MEYNRLDVRKDSYFVKLLLAILLQTLLVNTSYTKVLPIFLSLDAAQIYTAPGANQELNIFSNLGNTYVAAQNLESILAVMVGLGATTYQQKNVLFNTSLRYLPINNIPVSGKIWELNSPLFENLAYTYRVRSEILLLENAFTWSHYSVQPSLILGLGRVVNRVSKYKEYPLSDTAAVSLNSFTDAKTIQLGYEVGAGLDYPIKNAVIELAYRFIGAGVARFGQSKQQTTTDRLSTGQIQYHTISLGMRFYYDYAV
jgi:opacity protein-like surface antigen